MVNLGIAGMGYIGRVHYEASRKLSNARVTAVATSRPAETRAFLSKEVRVFESYEQLLRQSGVDAVIIAVPTSLHEEYAAQAAACGKHILCEKPFALDEAAARRMLAAADRASVILMVAQVLRFWPQYVRIKELVSEGALGSVRAAHAWRLASYPPWGGWFRDPAVSGGCRLDVQVHDMDFIFWLLGRPEGVRAAGLKSAAGAWDHVLTTLQYPGAIASLEASFLMPQGWPFSCGIRATGEAGCLEYEFRVAGNVADRAEVTSVLRLYSSGQNAKVLSVADEDMYARQLRYFAECVETGSKPKLCPPSESCEVMSLMDRCLDSLETGRTVAV